MEEKIVIDGTEYLVGHTREYVKAAIPWEEGKKGADDHWNNGFHAE